MRPPSHKLGAGEDIDNYTRHFVPFPISTFALCSVHRTSVIKRPTVDYCVILKKLPREEAGSDTNEDVHMGMRPHAKRPCEKR